METIDHRSSPTSWWFVIHTKLYRYRALMRKYWWLVLGSVAVGLAAAGWRVATEPVTYVSLGRLIVSGKIAMPEGGTFNEEVANYMGTQIQLLQSDQVRTRAVSRIQAADPTIEILPVRIEVAPAPQASVLNLKATGPGPQITHKMLEGVMQEYIGVKREIRSEKSELTLSAITDQISRLEKEIGEDDQAVIDFQKKNNIGYLREEGNSAATYLSGLNRQLADLKKEYQLLERLDFEQNLERQQTRPADSGGAEGNEGIRISSASGGPELEYLKTRREIEVLKAQKADYGKTLRPKHPIMVELDQQITQQESMIASFKEQSVAQLKTRKDSLRLEVENLEGVIQEWEAKALILSEKLAQFESMKSKVERKKNAWDRLQSNFLTIDANRAVDQDNVSVLQPAGAPFAVKPGVVRMLVMGFLAGLIFGMLLLFVIDQLDDRVASFVEFQTRFNEKVLAQIPRDKVGSEVGPLQPDDPRHAFAEALRSLRSSIFFMPVEGIAPKVFLVTSAVPNEGKSTVATNLAITMALANSRVLLVDGDLRRGAIHEVFGLSNQRGFSDVLREGVGLMSTIQPTYVPDLFLLPRGTVVSNPGELYLSKSADQFLKDVYEDYDYIVIDSSPVMAADDTTSLAPKVDATLFVFRFTHSSSRTSRKAIELLRDRQSNVLGVICNDVDEAMQEYYYYRYPEYYGTGSSKKHAG